MKEEHIEKGTEGIHFNAQRSCYFSIVRQLSKVGAYDGLLSFAKIADWCMLAIDGLDRQSYVKII